MFLGMNNTRLERKILIILDFENGFLPTYLPQWTVTMVFVYVCTNRSQAVHALILLPCSTLRVEGLF